MAVISTIDNSVVERQAQAIITLLETFQPRSALKPHLMQLKAVVKNLEFDEDLSVVLTSATSSESTVPESQKDEDFIRATPIDEPETKTEDYQPVPDLVTKLEGGDTDGNACSDNDNDNDTDNNESDNKTGPGLCELKPSKSFNSHNSVDSTTVLRSETFYLDAESILQSVTEGTKKMTLLSPRGRPRNENLSPNKPPTPMKSSSMKSPSHSTLMPASSLCSEKYQDADKFLDDVIRKVDSDPVIQKVFEDSSILARILEFDGSLAAYYKNYDLISGYKTPQQRLRNKSRFQRRPGTNQLAFVNRKFHSLIIRSEGLEQWKNQARLEIESWKRIARQIMTNSSKTKPGSMGPSPLAKIFAIVVRNDAIEFEYLLSKHLASQQGSSFNNDNGNDIFGMALREYVKGGEENFGTSRNMGLPQAHPFLKCVQCWHAKEFYYTTLLAELAYNAVICGAHDVLSVLSSRHNTLYSTGFGPTGGQNLLGEVVAYACTKPCCLDEISQGIRTLMVNQRFDQDELHANQRGSVGNSLHLAAAKGDRDLVDALLDIGCDPGVKCDQRALHDNATNNSVSGHCREQTTGSNEKMWYPEDWARVRGHTRVVRLLTRRRKQLRQQQQAVRTVLSGSTTGSTIRLDDSQTADYDTITANDTVTADYDSNSSCSSDYDSEFDSDGSHTSGSSEFDSDDDTCLYNNDSYNYAESPRAR